MSSGGGSVGGFQEGSKGSAKQKSKVRVPKYLQPFIQQATGAAGTGLGGLEELLGGGQDLVADLNQTQLQGLGQAADVAGGAGGFLPQAQQTFMNQAQGNDVSSFLDPSALGALQGASQGTGLDQFIPQNALSGLNQLATNDPSNQGINTLQQTAGGDFLHGGQGFEAAVQAAVNSATPHIASAFGGTAGGLSGGLARQAVGDTAVDAFASQFGQERKNQLNAAGALNQNTLQGSSALAGLGGDERSRGLGSAGQLAGLTGQLNNSDQQRALQAAGQLPNIGLAGSNILQGVGDQLQGQEQSEIEGPIAGFQQLLQSALGGLPISDLLGSKTSGSSKTFSQGIQGSGGK